MRFSFSKTVSTARRRLKRLKAAGVDNNAMKVLESELDVFYHKSGIKKRGTGISIDDRMTAAEKRKMNDILRSFVKSPLSTLTGIKKEAEKITGEKLTSAIEAAKIVDAAEMVILSDTALTNSLGSQVIHDIYEVQKTEGFEPDIARMALSNYLLHADLEGKSSDDVVAEIINDIDDLIDQGFDYD